MLNKENNEIGNLKYWKKNLLFAEKMTGERFRVFFALPNFLNTDPIKLEFSMKKLIVFQFKSLDNQR